VVGPLTALLWTLPSLVDVVESEPLPPLPLVALDAALELEVVALELVALVTPYPGGSSALEQATKVPVRPASKQNDRIRMFSLLTTRHQERSPSVGFDVITEPWRSSKSQNLGRAAGSVASVDV